MQGCYHAKSGQKACHAGLHWQMPTQTLPLLLLRPVHPNPLLPLLASCGTLPLLLRPLLLPSHPLLLGGLAEQSPVGQQPAGDAPTMQD